MKQCDLAASAGLSANALVAIEKDKSFPSKRTIDSICTALGISTACLLIHSVEETDLPPDKQFLFKYLIQPLQEELLPTKPHPKEKHIPRGC